MPEQPGYDPQVQEYGPRPTHNPAAPQLFLDRNKLERKYERDVAKYGPEKAEKKHRNRKAWARS